MSTLNDMLKSVRAHLPVEKVAYPTISDYTKQGADLLENFKKNLTIANGKWYEVSSVEEAQDIMKQNLPEANVICSAASEWIGNKAIEDVARPQDLDDVDLGVARAEFGVAEMGMVWLTEKSLKINVLAFLSQHMAILLDPSDLTENMHTAYKRVHLDHTNYGCFVMGPSATADIGAYLVKGAQGARSLTVFFLKK